MRTLTMDKEKIRKAWEVFIEEISDELWDTWVTKYDKGFMDAMHVVEEGLYQEGGLLYKKKYCLNLFKEGKKVVEVDFISNDVKADITYKLANYNLDDYDTISIVEIK